MTPKPAGAETELVERLVSEACCVMDNNYTVMLAIPSAVRHAVEQAIESQAARIAELEGGAGWIATWMGSHQFRKPDIPIWLAKAQKHHQETCERAGKAERDLSAAHAALAETKGPEFNRRLDIVTKTWRDRAEKSEAALAEAQRDAARYRWLRDKSPGQFEQPIVVTQARAADHMKYVGPLAYAALDAAIDAALSSTGEGSRG